MSSVPSMEAEGITRACTMVPVIRKNASATQTQESSSRTKRWRKVFAAVAGKCLSPPATTVSAAEALTVTSGLSESALEKLSFTEPSFPMALSMAFSAAFFGPFTFGNRDLFAGSGRHADLELYVFRHVVAGVTGSAEAARRVANGAAQAFQ